MEIHAGAPRSGMIPNRGGEPKMLTSEQAKRAAKRAAVIRFHFESIAGWLWIAACISALYFGYHHSWYPFWFSVAFAWLFYRYISSNYDRRYLTLSHAAITIFMCLQAIYKSSIFVGGTALLGYTLCFCPVATFVGSMLARHEKDYSKFDLTMIFFIASILTVAGLWLVAWSGFRIIVHNVTIAGLYWAILGIVTAIVITRKNDAL
jgi:hypothetical protein